MSCQKILLLVKNHLQINVVLKQLGLQQAILMRLLALDLDRSYLSISAMNEIADANNKMLQSKNVIKKIFAKNKKKTTTQSTLSLQTNSN